MKLRSFTIIEIVVTLVIIMVFAGIVIPDLWASQQRITGEMFINNVHDIVTTLELYKKENGGFYPEQIEELESYYNKPPINQYTKNSMLVSNSYQAGIQYIPSSDLKSYTLIITQQDINDLDRDNDKTESIAEALNQPFSFSNISPVTPTVARTYTITLVTNPEAAGILSAIPNPAKVDQTVMLSQIPNKCYEFNSWTSSDVTINNNKFTMPAKNIFVTANYTPKRYNISVIINDPSYGTVTGAGTHNCGSTATLQAIPATGFSFAGWYEGTTQVSTSTTYSFTVNRARTLEARFSAIQYNITMKANPTGGGSPSAAPNPAYVGQPVTLSANPGSCYNFSSWSVSAGTLSGNTLTMPAQDVTATANYTLKTYNIAVNITKTGNSPNTPGIVTGAGTYNCGSTATLIVTPATEYVFVGWYENNNLVSTSTIYSFTVDSDRMLEAKFRINIYTITLIANPADAGSPTATPNPAVSGATVTLTANPSTCYNFIDWSVSAGTLNGNTLTMPAQDVTATANYTIKTYNIAVNITKTGNSPNTPGTVTGAGTYNCGSSATLVATPATGFGFAGWYEGTTQVSTNATYTFPVNSSRTIEARFGAYDYKVTVVANPTGAGSPVATPQYAAVGETVTLTPNPSSNYNFSSWSAPAGVTITNNSFIMPAQNVTITANYVPKSYTITLKSNPTGAGSPSASPNPATAGQTVTLSANPGTNYKFSNWSAPSGVTITNNSFVMPAQNVTITANYVPKSYTITLKSNPTGAGSPSASPNPATAGQTVTLSANPGSCYNFSSWSVSAGSLSGNTLTMPAQNVTATANYAIKKYTITLSVNNSNYGTVSGGGSYNCGSSATVVATPATGYNFLGWYEGTTRVSTNATYTFTVNGNRTLEARFGVSASSYTITIVYEAEVPPSGNIATVSKNPASPGESVTLTIDKLAISSCYLYGGWRSPDLGQIKYNLSSTSYTFTMPAQNVTIYIKLPTNPNHICW